MEETKEGGTGTDEEDSRGGRLQARRRPGAADAAPEFHRRRFVRLGGGLGRVRVSVFVSSQLLFSVAARGGTRIVGRLRDT